MSNLPEAGYGAVWMKDLEFELWKLMNDGREIRFGHHNIRLAELNQLKELSIRSGCWTYFDDVTAETAIDLVRWKQIFQNRPT